jgi:hypothetical protein
MTGRGSTYAGRPSLLPAQGYPGPDILPAAGSSGTGRDPVVSFHGEDGRHAVFSFAGLPLPGWHQALAAGLAERTGPGGGLRTLASANSAWAVMKRLVRFLASQPPAPATQGGLNRAHMEAFLLHRSATIGRRLAWAEVRSAGWLFAGMPAGHRVGPEVFDFVFQRVEGMPVSAKTGYSDSELRQVITAARSDVVSLRNRIRCGQALAARWQQGDSELTGPQRQEAGSLAGIAATGEVPWPGYDRVQTRVARRELASRLYVTRPDVWPLMILLVALTGRSPDALKELPAEHRILEDQAVELVLVKRRRGAGHWHETVTWEIGPPGRELHQPGGFYLLLHQLMAAGRTFSGSPLVWSVWQNADAAGEAEHVNPFARSLNMPDLRQRWDDAHGLTGDDGKPLWVDLQRLKTSIEVRRTRQLGGHLPSAARTNTMPVLFRNYLRGDPTVRDWAEQVVGDAIADAEQQAIAAHRRAMRAAGGGPHVDAGGPAAAQHAAGDSGAAGNPEGPWSACADPQRHPATGKPCQASFLDCFHCGNCLITRDHLPQLRALADALAFRRQQLTESEWWQRYGPAWAAIRHDILGRFSPAEIRQAELAAPGDALLDLVENPWEAP